MFFRLAENEFFASSVQLQIFQLPRIPGKREWEDTFTALQYFHFQERRRKWRTTFQFSILVKN